MEQHFSPQPSEQPNNNGRVSASALEGGIASRQAASLDEIDSLLSFLPPLPTTIEAASTARSESSSAKPETFYDEVDLLLQDLDRAIDETIGEIKRWDTERKRLEARQTTDAFILETLARDENPLVRTLAFCNPSMPSEQLQKMGRGENQWFQMLAANNTATPSEILDELSASEVPDIRQGVIKNPSTSPVTLHKINANQTY